MFNNNSSGDRNNNFMGGFQNSMSQFANTMNLLGQNLNGQQNSQNFNQNMGNFGTQMGLWATNLASNLTGQAPGPQYSQTNNFTFNHNGMEEETGGSDTTQNFWNNYAREPRESSRGRHTHPYSSNSQNNARPNQDSHRNSDQHNRHGSNRLHRENSEQNNQRSQQRPHHHSNSGNQGHAQFHRTNQNNCPKPTPDEVCKEQGNAFFRQKQYAAAIERYQAAIVSSKANQQ